MTDIHSHTHRTTVPKGLIRPQVWASQIAVAKRVLPPHLVELVTHIKQPFVSVISSVASAKASYYDGHLFLIGDALTQTQPNVGMGTNLAAFAAFTLAEEVIGKVGEGEEEGITKEKVEGWEKKVMDLNEVTRMRSVAFGSWYLNGWIWIGWYYARWRFMAWWLGRKSFI